MLHDQPTVLYIHGFNSSPWSHKARQLTAAMQRAGLGDQLRVPALHHHPTQAMAQLQTALGELGRPLLVGSSLGGYYATSLAERHGLKALLINPAVRPHRRFRAYLGPQTNFHTGEVWNLDEGHVAALAALDVPPPGDALRYQVWLQTGDETLDYREAETFYQGCALRIEEGGDHAYQGFVDRLAELLAFAGFDPACWRDVDFSDL
ncbi:YqiA/YcfP family alpha/beta fold hydrolase [Stutzerimonas tarimensis]|uniref:YqiA/YcfP family alpha/beta fold hydrolase n=1 Tax=Stutzerimonas tarimensis TaxID=1507735 RepID=A0ABV7T5D2_9GAMM